MMVLELTEYDRVDRWVRHVLDGFEQPENGLYRCEEFVPAVKVEAIFFKTLRPEYLIRRIIEESMREGATWKMKQ